MVDIKVKNITELSVVTIDKNLYSLEELQAAAYLYTEFSSFNFKDTKSEFLVEIQKLPHSDLNSEDVLHLFKNQLFMESLRMKIAFKTEAERNLILAYAFSNTPLVN
jgi:His-Xaa-Ser system protein HxsD